MNYGSPALCVPFQQVGRRLACDRRFYNSALGQRGKKKKKKKKTYKNATHYIKGSHCHGDQ